ncbi:DNA-directed RNA polymerase, mitochondrial [Sphaceloma murrayae]|uniref:DNA-directed RNA polymerase, mitochondrial n=1 Tax=Sphaceloma murrayae TaxID=2082308 RepID=A0A2K1QUU8_9PEZI|nr:DNA-directed RNA polymerase, mitochondrial [Sphaceloma murrayae]
MAQQEPSILIIGAGTFGVSTAWHLAKTYRDPSRVTIIDRSPSPPEPAAAIDINRIIRTDYNRPLYCNLAYTALHDWFWTHELQSHFFKVGWLYLNDKGSDLAKEIRATLRDRGSNLTEDVDLEELDKRWSVLQGTDTGNSDSAYFNPDAGWCNAAAATASLMSAAEERGVKRVIGDVHELILDMDTGGIKSVCTTEGQHYTADKIVLAVGAWTSSVLSPLEEALGLPEQDRVESQVRATGGVTAYYKVSRDEVDRIAETELPCVVYGEQGEVIPPSRDNYLIKYSNTTGTFTNTVKTPSGNKITVPAIGRSQYNVPDAIKRETEEAMCSRVMPQYTRGRSADYWRICWDAFTPTEDWLLCKHPHEKLANLYLAVGGSFHSYKFLPVAGRFMLKVLDGESNGEEMDRAWSWKRGVDWDNATSPRLPKRELRDLLCAQSGPSAARLGSKL